MGPTLGKEYADKRRKWEAQKKESEEQDKGEETGHESETIDISFDEFMDALMGPESGEEDGLPLPHNIRTAEHKLEALKRKAMARRTEVVHRPTGPAPKGMTPAKRLLAAKHRERAQISHERRDMEKVGENIGEMKDNLKKKEI